MKYKNYRRLPDSSLKMQLTFWRNIRSFIETGDKMDYGEIGDLYLKKFGYRITKKHILSKRGIDFNEDGFAILSK